MKEFRTDLHVHTVLSPCAAREMTPPAIVQAAVAKKLDMIAICDHNSAANVRAVQQAAGGRLTVLAGMEIASAEEVHVLGIFPSAKEAMDVSERIGQTLPPVDPQYTRRFGVQTRVDAAGRPVSDEPKSLAHATIFSLSEVVKLITNHFGVAIAAHTDRPSFSVSSQLGPVTAPGFWNQFAAAELADPNAGALHPAGVSKVTGSDSHCLSQIGRAFTTLKMAAASFEELVKALAGADGRGVAGMHCEKKRA